MRDEVWCIVIPVVMIVDGNEEVVDRCGHQELAVIRHVPP